MVDRTKPGLEYTETLRGIIAVQRSGAPRREKPRQRTLELTLRIFTGDLKGALSRPGHVFHIDGEVRAQFISPEPLRVSEGVVELLALSAETPDTREMRYRMKMISRMGRAYYFEGSKTIHKRLINAFWREVTTLRARVYDGESPAFPLLGEAILRNEDLVRLLGSVRVTDARNRVAGAKTAARFAEFLACIFWDEYGGMLAPMHFLRTRAAARPRRPLLAPPPEVHYFKTADGVRLRLLRYRGGSKGPVILSHGIGVSSLIFRTDTIKTNLVEFLVARGFDVWALDYRGSIELAAHKRQFTADDVAAYDYPAVVGRVRELTGARTVQMVVHCFGSVAFFMSMLKGLRGVRSVVSSQVATHLVTAPITEIKCGIYIPEALEKLGISSLNARVTGEPRWEGKLGEAAMRFYAIPPKQLCSNPVCHRITFMYSQVFEHQKLNALTHKALGEMFGATNIRAFAHLARMVRAGHIVTAGGRDAYLPHLDRLAIPIAFVHGGSNRCFLPMSTELTYNLLCDRNGRSLYSRTVIPGYGHADSIIGRDAALDVYPAIARHLEATES